MRQDVDEVGHFDLTLCAVSSAGLGLASVRVVLCRQNLVVETILKGIGVETTVASP